MHYSPTRIVVQIPCLNEEETLPGVIADIRNALAGEPDVKILVIDDGSTDRTAEVARQAGADWIAIMPYNVGLARAFTAGLQASLRLGAAVIINTDADNQYCAADIPKLILPIREGKADMVVGARPIGNIDHFPWYKKLLQRAGSATVRRLSGAAVEDATSGFRAISRDLALRLNVFTPFTYTLETIIQAGRSGKRVTSTPIRVNGPTRPSRLFRSIRQYLQRSVFSLLKVFTIYRPMSTFFYLGLLPFLGALGLSFRYLFLISFVDPTRSHAPSLILAAILFIMAFVSWAIGIIGDLVASNRRLLEEIQVEQRRARLTSTAPLPGNDNYRLVSLTETADEAG